MSGLKLFFLDPPWIELDSAPVDIRRRRALALLIYLATSNQTHSRNALAAIVFSQSGSASGAGFSASKPGRA